MGDRLGEAHELVPFAPGDTDDQLDGASIGSFSLDELHRHHHSGSLTRINGLALVISLQIGSGIFSAPSQVSQFVPTPGYGLLVWLLGGALVWTGAASFVELGLRVPANGGIQEYMRACYGDAAAFLFTWSWVVIAKPAANATIAMIFADYLTSAFVSGHLGGESRWLLKLVAVACVMAVTSVNCLGATAGAKAANMFLALKLAALLGIAALGGLVWAFGYGEGVQRSEAGWFGRTDEQRYIDAWTWVGNFTTALFGALFCYGGWETVGFVLGDMSNPEGDLPVVIHGAMATVIAGFLAMNAALYVCLPMDVMRSSSTIAVEFAIRTMGVWGGLIFSLLVSISAMGALNANVFATAKLVVAASQRRYFPGILANLHCASAKDEAEYLERMLWWCPPILSRPIKLFAASTREPRWQRLVPIFPLLINGLLASFYVTVGSFNGLVTFIGLAEYAFFLLSVIGLLILRRGDSQLAGAPGTKYRTWTANPLIFSAVSGLLIIRGVASEPLQGVAIVVAALLGGAVFYSRFGSRGFTSPQTV